MILLLDIGNSRTKWALLDAQGLGGGGASPHGGGTAVLPANIPATPDHVYAANVAGSRVADALEEAVRGRWGCPLSFARPSASLGDVCNGYEDIRQLGVDRWFAVVAAFHHARTAVCVVDAGTATTVDLVDAAGQHLGGFILPGVDLMMQSLFDGTGDLGRLQDRRAAKVVLDPGKTTGSAMRNGAWLATIGLIEQARARLPAKSALVITGGQGAVLAELLGAPFHERLVLEGLALGWRAGAAA